MPHHYTNDNHPSFDDPNSYVFYRSVPTPTHQAPRSTLEPPVLRNSTNCHRYYLSLPAAIIFIILFCATTGMHIYQATRTRTWFMTALIVGGFCKSPPFIILTLLHPY